MKTDALTCRVCQGSIAIRPLDRERGWVECSFCVSVRRIGAPLPVASERSPHGRMLWVHKGDRDDIVVRATGGPKWLYPFVGWLGVVALGTLAVGGLGANIVTLLILLTAIAYLAWRRTEAQFTIEREHIRFTRFFRGRRLWAWEIPIPEGAQPVLAGVGLTPKLAIAGQDEHRILMHLHSTDERRWLERVFQESLAPNEAVGTTSCTHCGAELEITPRARKKEALNCDYCGTGLVFQGAGARATVIALSTGIDLQDRADLFPDDVGVEHRRSRARGAEWIIAHPTAQLVMGAALLIGAGIACYLAVQALSIVSSGHDSHHDVLRFYGRAWGAAAFLIFGGVAWMLAAPDYGTLAIRVTDRSLFLDKTMWGQRVCHYELPLISLWNVEVRSDERSRLITLAVNTCFRSVTVNWKLDDIDTPMAVRELFAELERRLSSLERKTIQRFHGAHT